MNQITPTRMEIQEVNKEYISNLRSWQAEAFIFCLLYCCLRHNALPKPNKSWNLSKVCSLYDIVGDIFSWEISASVIDKVQSVHVKMPDYHDFITKRSAEVEYLEKLSAHQDFRNNIRLIPKEAHRELIEICTSVLDLTGRDDDKVIEKILKEETI